MRMAGSKKLEGKATVPSVQKRGAGIGGVKGRRGRVMNPSPPSLSWSIITFTMCTFAAPPASERASKRTADGEHTPLFPEMTYLPTRAGGWVPDWTGGRERAVTS